MLSITVISKSTSNAMMDYLKKLRDFHRKNILEKYGKLGVAALSAATPVDTGLTAASWRYEYETNDERSVLSFHNDNFGEREGRYKINIALILQYGHGTGTGGWVEGRDYINPAIQPIFDDFAKRAWGEVTAVYER